MRDVIERVDRLMAPVLTSDQADELHAVLVACLIGEGKSAHSQHTTEEYIELFLPQSDSRVARSARCGITRARSQNFLRRFSRLRMI